MEVDPSFALYRVLHNVPHQHKGNLFLSLFSGNSILFLLLLFPFLLLFLENMFQVLIPS